MKTLKTIFRRPTLLEVACRELAEAEMAKLSAETGQEYAEAQVQYNTSRIFRLRSFIATQGVMA